MRNIAGFFVAVALAALAFVGYGYYNKAQAAKTAEVISATNPNSIYPTTPEVVEQKAQVTPPAPVEKPKAEKKAEVAPQPEKKVEPKVAEKPKSEPKPEAPKVAEKPKSEPKPEAPKTAEKPKTEGVNFDKKMREYGLVDIRTLDKNILVELKYSTTDNFVGKDMYGSLERAYLERNFANKVIKAQQILRKRYPNYTLLIYDAARPISVQRTMKKIVEGTEFDSFVASGTRGGRHNYGVAVDLTIADKNGKALDMGTGFDSFDKASAVKGTSDNSDPSTRTIAIYRAFVRKLQADGLISKKAADNRILLLEVMYEAGLYPYRNEWWHFELINSMANIRETYRLLDF